MKFKWIAWIGLLSFVIVLISGFLFAAATATRKKTDQAEGFSDTAIQQSVVRMGNLEVSVNGSGELVSSRDVSLSFPESGKLVALNVKVGDEVDEGDVLAQLQIDQSPADRAAAIANAQLDVIRMQQNLDNLHINAQMEAAQAQVELEQSQEYLDDLKDSEFQLALAQQAVYDAKEAIEDAETNLYIVTSMPSQEAMDIAYAGLLFREKDLAELQERIEKTERQVKSAPNKAIGDRLRQQLMSLHVELAEKRIEHDNAVYKYETMDEPAEELDVTLAETRLRTAQAQLSEAEKYLEEVVSGSNNGEIALAEAMLMSAQEIWGILKDGPDPVEIAVAEAELTKAQAKLALIEQEQLVLDLVATTGGRVISVDAAVGDRVNQNQIITLVDLTQLMIQVEIDETDLLSVQVGNQATVVFDALPGKTFAGTVVTIDPSLQRAGNSVAFQASVQLESQSFLKELPIGLSASVEVIAGQVENAVLVSLEALHQESENNYFVYVIDGETLERRPVEIGLMDLTTAEIVTGLAPGEVIALNYPESYGE